MRGLSLTATSFLVFPSHSCHILAQPPPPSVLPPSQDAFYSSPERPETHAPGEILRIRTALAIVTSSVPNCSAAYHIVYRTTDARFRPSWAVTTLLLPPSYNPSSASPRPLLSYQLAYNSPDIDASPSYDFSALTAPGGAVAVALGRGWIVSVPDSKVQRPRSEQESKQATRQSTMSVLSYPSQAQNQVVARNPKLAP